MNDCAECDFRYATVPAADLPLRLAEGGRRFAAALAAHPEPRRRPAPLVWSPLEYGCHVRDVLRVQTERLALALRVDEPEFAPMDRDERVVRDRYHAQDPAVVRAEVTAAADELAGAFGRLGPEQWDRTGIYNWPTVAPRTMLWLGQHTVHELEHHLRDITR